MPWSKRTWCFQALGDMVLSALLAAGAAGCAFGAHSAFGTHPASGLHTAHGTAPATRRVVLRVEGHGTAGLAWTAAGHGTVRSSLPWHTTLPAASMTQGLTLTAVLGARGGTATCSVTVDGHRLAVSRTRAAHGRAACRIPAALIAPARSDIAVEPVETSGLAALAVAAQAGDEQAFAQIYCLLNPALLAYLRKLVGDMDAEDVTSETWGLIMRALPRFRGDSDGFRGWAFTIARHRALNHLSRRRPVLPLPTEELPVRPALDDTAQGALDAVSTRWTLATISNLPDDQARAVLLRTVVGLNAPQAARILGKKPASVRAATSRGLRNLAHRLSRSRTGDAP